jgi:integrase
MSSIRKRFRNGRQIGFEAAYTDQNKRRIKKLFEFERDAKAFLRKVDPEVAAGTHTPEGRSITVAEAGELWIEHRREVEKLETATLRQYGNHLKHHIASELGRVTLAKLTAPAVAKFRDELLKTRSRVMVGKVLTSLRSILALAQERGLVAQNVAASVRLGAKSRRENRKLEIGKGIPRKDELRAILAATEGTRWYPLIATAALAGLRSSELRGLRWQDVDLHGATLRVEQRADERNQMGAPKSEAGHRAIPMMPILVNILRRWREVGRAGELVFGNGLGHVESHANLYNRGWRAAQLRAGIVDERGRTRYKFHACRHFFAAIMIETNPMPKRLQEMMGHSTLAMTMDTYGALFEAGEDERAKMEKAGAFLHGTKVA